MLNFIIKFCLPWRSQIEVPLAGLILTLGIYAGEAKAFLTNDLQTPLTSQVFVLAEAFGKDTVNAPKGKLPQVDGIYLYGKSPKSEQIGQEYMVFEVRQGKVMGAIYMPHSEFSCFYGTFQSGELAMMIASSPDTEPYPDPVVGQNSQHLATASNKPPVGNAYNPITYIHSVALRDYHQLTSISANDKRILGSCKANYQQ